MDLQYDGSQLQFLGELPEFIREQVLKSIEQAENEEFISLEDVKKKIAILLAHK